MEDVFNLLKKTGFYGKGLFKVDDPELVHRYNKCLVEIGLEPTMLTEFSIDGMGYSPEIASEKNDEQYLSHKGISNPYAIILSPEQKDLPIYKPYYSFSRAMMSDVFRTFAMQITDLTLYTGIYIDLDEGLSHITTPEEILLVELVMLKFHVVGQVANSAKSQRETVAQLQNGHNWANESVIGELIDNIKENGDLRYKRMQLEDLPFTDIRSFYTTAFDGLYVIRDVHEMPILVHAGTGKTFRTKDNYTEYRISDPDLFERLLEHKIIDLYPGYYRDVDKLKQLEECMFAYALAEQESDIDIKLMTPGHRKKMAIDLMSNGKLSPLYDEISKLIHLSQRDRIAYIDNASKELQRILAHPHKRVKGTSRLIVHRLLAHMMPVDMLSLYAYAQESFYELYAKWPKNKQVWAAAFLKERYVSPYIHSEPKQIVKKRRKK